MDPKKQALLERLKKYKYEEQAVDDIVRTYEEDGLSREEAFNALNDYSTKTGKKFERFADQKPPSTITEWSRKRFGDNPGKALADFGVGFGSGIIPGMAMGPAIGLGMGIVGGIGNAIGNADEPFLSANNFANVASIPAGGAMSKLLKGASLPKMILGNVAENVGTTAFGRGAGELAGNPSPRSAMQDYAVGAGTPLALGTGTALAARGAKHAPAVWQQMIESMKPKTNPTQQEQAMSEFFDFAKKVGPAEEKLRKLKDSLANLDFKIGQLPLTEKSFTSASKTAKAARERLQQILEKRANVGFEIGDEILEAKAAQTEAQKALSDLRAKFGEGKMALQAEKAKFKIKDYEGSATHEDEVGLMRQEQEYAEQAADNLMEQSLIEGTILDSQQKVRERQNTAKFNAQYKTKEQLTAEEAKKGAVFAETKKRQKHADLLSKVEDGSYEVEVLKKELDDEIKSTGFDPTKMAPESKALLMRVAEKSPETVIESLIKESNSQSKEGIKNLFSYASGKPRLELSLRSALAEELIKPTRIFYHGSQGDIVKNTAGNIADDFLGRIHSLGPDSINEIFGSKNAYKNLEGYAQALAEAQRTFPSPGAGSYLLGAGAGSMLIPYYFTKSPWSAAAGAAGAGAYLHIQTPEFINKIVRGSDYFSGLFQRMVKNPEKFMSGSMGSRLLNAYLRKSADSVTVEIDGKQRTIPIPKNQ